MGMTDSVADMLTRIRNAIQVKHLTVDIPRSRVKAGLAQVLKQEGYIRSWQEVPGKAQGKLRVYLKYGPDGEPMINEITRISRPGGRVYRKLEKIVPYLKGAGTWILSTPQGVLSDREARERKVGGEVICRVS